MMLTATGRREREGCRQEAAEKRQTILLQPVYSLVPTEWQRL